MGGPNDHCLAVIPSESLSVDILRHSTRYGEYASDANCIAALYGERDRRLLSKSENVKEQVTIRNLIPKEISVTVVAVADHD